MNDFKRILFIDDDHLQRELTTRLYNMCRRCFHGEAEFITVASWESGMEIMQKHQVDVAIVDLTLPPMRKEDTLIAIRNTPNLPPVIVLTGSNEEGLRKLAYEHGAEDFMEKSEVNRNPELLCERCYSSYLRVKYRNEQRAKLST